MQDYESKHSGEEIDAILDDVENKVDKVEGKGLSTNDYTDEDKSQVESMYSMLYESIEVDLSASKKGILDVGSNTYLDISGFKYIEIPISSGTTVSYAGRNGGSSMAMIVVKDANDNIIRVVDRGDGSYTERTGTIHIAEKNAEKIVFTYSEYSKNPYLRIDIPDDVENKVDKVEGKGLSTNDYTDEDKSQVESMYSMLYGSIDVDLSTSKNGILDVDSNKYVDNSTFKYIEIPISSGTTVSYAGRNGGSSMAMIVVKDANDNIIRVVDRGDGSYTDRTGTIHIAEKNAKKIVFTYSKYSANPYLRIDNPIDISKLPQAVDAADKAVSRKYPLRVLLIGSSHGMNAISQVPWICYKSGFNVIVGNVYKGSLTLQQVATAIENNTSIGGWFKVFSDGKWVTSNTTIFDDVIRYADWDYIIVQRSASDDNTWEAEQSNALATIISRINDVATNTPAILFNSGFADPSSNATAQKDVTQTIMTTAMNMQLEHQIEIIPVATAIQNARGTSLGNIGAYAHKDMCYDSQHLDYGIGCYVASATIVQHILSKYGWDILTMKGYGTYEEAKSFVDTLVDTGGERVAYTEPTSETIRIAKLCAKAAFFKPMEVNERLAELFPLV